MVGGHNRGSTPQQHHHHHHHHHHLLHQGQHQHPLPLETRHDVGAPGSSAAPTASCRPQPLHGLPPPPPPPQHGPTPNAAATPGGRAPPQRPLSPPAAAAAPSRLDPPVTGVTASPLVAMDAKKGGVVGGGGALAAAAAGAAGGRRKGGGGGGGAGAAGGGGSSQQLRSPLVKRPPSAPVTLQGWLHKQGSDGLMLWKKRWFVLSEYCLFYYKGPEEEKLLGSILLPSYKVAPCAPEDRVFRKFAFKAEHANMRTYYFAADAREAMVQWMNALSLASILQDGNSWEEHRSGRPSVSSISSLLNQSADDSDSGFHGYRPRPGAAPAAAPAAMGQMPSVKSQLNSSHDSALSNGWGAQRSPQQLQLLGDPAAFHQPLYANAPPKPRRMADGDVSPDAAADLGLYEPRIAQPQEPVSPGARSADLRYHYHYAATTPAERRTPDTYGRSNSATPAPAPAAAPAPAPGATPKKNPAGDYEDVYAAGVDAAYAHLYRRHSGQLPAPASAPAPAQPFASPYAAYRYAQEQALYGTHPGAAAGTGAAQHGGRPASRHPPRPHSADFLELDARRHQHSQHAFQQHSLPHPHAHRPPSAYAAPQPARLTRPKSSLDVAPASDSYYWSEESYAQKMRQSASYLHQRPATNAAPAPAPATLDGVVLRHGKRSAEHPLTPDHRIPSDPRIALAADPRVPLAQDPRLPLATDPRLAQDPRLPLTTDPRLAQDPRLPLTADPRLAQDPRLPLTTDPRLAQDPRIPLASDPRIPVTTDPRIPLVADPRLAQEVPGGARVVPAGDPRSPSRPHYQQLQQRRWSEYSDPRANGQFIRSASARLPRQRYQDDDDDAGAPLDDHRQRSSSDVRDGCDRKIQQREESMKRLLEWKQRMLQSPLTRKPSGSSNRGTAQNELSRYYKQQVLRELATQEAQAQNMRTREDSGSSGRTRRRPLPEDVHTIPGPGRSAPRSRSQDGRRSSASVNRYNSFSSDDEEEGDVRKARKRVRRPSQAGRSRPGSSEGRPSRRHPPSASPPSAAAIASAAAASAADATPAPAPTPPAPAPDDLPDDNDADAPTYENIIPIKSPGSAGRHHHHHHHHHHPSPREGIPPDAPYGEDQRHFVSTKSPTAAAKPAAAAAKSPSGSAKSPSGSTKSGSAPRATKSHSKSSHPHGEQGKRGDEHPRKDAKTPPPAGAPRTELKYSPEMPVIVSSKLHKYPDYQLRSGNNTLNKSSGDSTSTYPSTQEDRNSCGKHSDSGYDTLQASRAFHEGQEIAELLKLRNPEAGARRSAETSYAVHDLQYKSTPKKSSQRQEKSDERSKEPREGGKEAKGEGAPRAKQYQRVETPPKNIVQNRIKAFEVPKGEEEAATQMQEPLKMSPPMYQPNEAHVSSLRANDAPAPPPHEQRAAQRAKDARTVRALLADFERKSQLAKASAAAEEQGGAARGVFSDTETLLYDSSDGDGDAPRRRPRSRGDAPPAPRLPPSDDDDKDDEVAAALGERADFESACRDLGLAAKPRKRKPSKGKASDPVEVIVTPGYLRLSMAESLVTHEDSESLCSTPTNPPPPPPPLQDEDKKKGEDRGSETPDSANPEEHYMPMTPSRKAVLAPLPDAFGSPAAHSIMMESIFGAEAEESAYVEMTEEGIVRSLLASEPNHTFLSKTDIKRLNSAESGTYATPDSPRYCEIASVFPEGASGPRSAHSHYEMLYRATTQQGEPVYMEVNPQMLKSKSEEEARAPSESSTLHESERSRSGEDDAGASPAPSARGALPDILSASPAAGAAPPKDLRDSSDADADDEASKDLDSIDAPRHPRFSLSDTFRPASYYLGHAGKGGERRPGGPDHPDSSDSDLVPPPPIPTSPPPIDELDNSLELPDSSLDSSLRAKGLAKTEDKGAEDPRRLWGKDAPAPGDVSSSGSECVELRRKRRPLSDDLLDGLEPPEPRYLLGSPFSEHRAGSDLESVGSRSGLALDADDAVNMELDQYLDDLQARDALLRLEPPASYGCFGPDKPFRRSDPFVVQRPDPVPARGRASDPLPLPARPRRHPPSDEEVLYENVQIAVPPPLPTSPPPLRPGERLDRLTGPAPAPTSTPGPAPGTAPEHVSHAEPVAHASRKAPSMDEQQLQQNAPYYYSDLLREDPARAAQLMGGAGGAMGCLRAVGGYPSFVSSSVATRAPVASSRAQLLNNQRTSAVASSARSDIGRKVNPIARSPAHAAPLDDADPRRLAAELRSTSAHFLGAADKRGRVDERNLYEADTIQRLKAPRARTPDFDLGGASTSAVNIYPHGLRDKSSPPEDTLPLPQPQRRSRSLEGLLDGPDFLRDFADRALPPFEAFPPPAAFRTADPVEPPPPPVDPAPSGSEPAPQEERRPCEGDDLWEEDALWRESLRRVSLRHTRSLDNLDGPAPGRPRSQSRASAAPSGRRSTDPPPRPKLSREVTYVNDSMVPPRAAHVRPPREYEEDYREGRRRGRRRPQDLQANAGGRDDGVHYERLARYSESLERTRRGQTYLEGYVWDAEREVFRKGTPTHGQATNPGAQRQALHFLEEVRLPAQPPPAFEIDREKLRQWDLMSSAPLASQVGAQGAGPGSAVAAAGAGAGATAGAEDAEAGAAAGRRPAAGAAVPAPAATPQLQQRPEEVASDTGESE